MTLLSTAALLILLALSGCGAPPAQLPPAEVTTAASGLRLEPASVIGSPGSGPAQFDRPMGLALDHRGHLYVVDMGNNRVQKFDKDGRFLLEFGIFGSEGGQFIEPVNATAAHGFSVAVTDARNERWQTFDLEGNFLVASAEGADERLGIPWGISRARDGRLFLSNTQDHSIVVIGLDGRVEFSFGGFGGGRGQLNLPSGLAFSEGDNLLVADAGNDRIQRFDFHGGPLGSWGRKGSGAGQLRAPRGVAVDRQGRVYVADTGNDRVQVFNAAGNWLGGYPSAGTTGDLSRPADVAVTGSRLYVADTGHDRVLEIRVIDDSVVH
jgi:DNA-binding beta-propeller fold protein YncE